MLIRQSSYDLQSQHLIDLQLLGAYQKLCNSLPAHNKAKRVDYQALCSLLGTTTKKTAKRWLEKLASLGLVRYIKEKVGKFIVFTIQVYKDKRSPLPDLPEPRPEFRIKEKHEKRVLEDHQRASRVISSEPHSVICDEIPPPTDDDYLPECSPEDENSMWYSDHTSDNDGHNDGHRVPTSCPLLTPENRPQTHAPHGQIENPVKSTRDRVQRDKSREEKKIVESTVISEKMVAKNIHHSTAYPTLRENRHPSEEAPTREKSESQNKRRPSFSSQLHISSGMSERLQKTLPKSDASKPQPKPQPKNNNGYLRTETYIPASPFRDIIKKLETNGFPLSEAEKNRRLANMKREDDHGLDETVIRLKMDQLSKDPILGGNITRAEVIEILKEEMEALSKELPF